MYVFKKSEKGMKVYMNKKNIINYVVSHKPINLNELNLDDSYCLIKVGNNEKFITEIKDSIGENISYKNNNYCELTALYWIWKNDKNDIIGFSHYRRYFLNIKNKILNSNDIDKIMKSYDIILPIRTKLVNSTVYEQYKKNHFSSDLDMCRYVILKKYPNYIKDYDFIIEGNEYCQCNMFVMNRNNLDKYCQWLFSILEEVEKIINFKNRDNYQQRVFGFLSERLFNVWIKHNNLKRYELYLLNTENINNKKNKIKNFLLRFGIKFNIEK